MKASLGVDPVRGQHYAGYSYGESDGYAQLGEEVRSRLRLRTMLVVEVILRDSTVGL